MNNDPRYQQLVQEEKTAQQKAADLTAGLANQSQTIATEQNQFLSDYQRGQQELLNRSVEQETQALERQKQQQQEIFNKEAGAAYTDYAKFVNPFGVRAEQQAQEGLLDAGYTETTKARAYGEYQNRYASAKTTLEQNNVTLNVAMQEARLKGDIQGAQLALDIFNQQTANTLRAFEFSSNLALQQFSINQSISQDFYNRQQNLISQITNERNFEYQRQQDALAQANWQKEFNALQQERNRNFALSKARSSSEAIDFSGPTTKTTSTSAELTAAQKRYDNLKKLANAQRLGQGYIRAGMVSYSNALRSQGYTQKQIDQIFSQIKE